MKKYISLLFAICATVFAQPTVPINNARFGGTSLIGSGAFLYAASGGSVGVQSGGTFYFQNGGLFSGDAAAFRTAIGAGAGGGTVTSVGVTTANGVSATPTPITTSGNFTFVLGAITPTTVVTGNITSSALTSGRVPFSTTSGRLTDAASLTFNSGTGALSAADFVGAIGGTTPAAGTFTTLSATGHTTFEGVTSTGATGTAKLVYSTAPTFTNLTTLSDATSSIVNETYSQNQLVVTKYTYPGLTAKGVVGMLSNETQLGYNINYDGRVHNLYDQALNSFYWTLNSGGAYLQFIPTGSNAPTSPDDIWVRTGSYPIAILASKNTLLGAARTYVDSGYRLSVESAGSSGAARFLNGGVLIDKPASVGTASTSVDTGAALQVLAANPGDLIQSWNYVSGTAFSLNLRQAVTAGHVKQIFDQVNNGTTYSNMLVFNEGNVGIGTASPSSTLDVAGTITSSDHLLVSSAAASYLHLKTTANTYSPYVRWEGFDRNWYAGAYDAGGDDNLNVSLNANLSSPLFSMTPIGALTLSHYGAGTATFDSSGNITSVSDARAKDTIGDFKKGLAEIRKLTPHLYHWKKETGLATGDLNVSVYAQDLIAAGLGEAVFTTRTVADTDATGKPKKDAKGVTITKTIEADYYTVGDRPIMAALINGEKTLADNAEALSARVAALESRLATIESKLK